MKENLTPDERKQWARTLYTTNGKTAKEVALTVNVDEATIREWIRQGLWNTVRRSLLISKNAQMHRLYDLVDKLNEKMIGDEEVNHKDVDLLLKYTAAIKNIDTDNSSTYALMDVAETFTSWLHRRDLELTKVFTEQFDIFVRERMATAA